MIESIKERTAQTKQQIIADGCHSLSQLYDDAYAKGVIEQRDFTNKTNVRLIDIVKKHVGDAWKDFEVARACNGVGNERSQKWLLVWSELDEVLRDCMSEAIGD